MILNIGNGVACQEIIGCDANNQTFLLIIGHWQAYDVVLGIVCFLGLGLLPAVVAQIGEGEWLFIGLDGLTVNSTLKFQFGARL